MFQTRGYMGWLTDMISTPRTHDAWPSIGIDQSLIDDYASNYRVMQQIGITTLGVWGFFVAREWPVEVEQAIDQQRTRQIATLFEQAHQHGIKVLSGLGVYSWGFEAIIRAHPHLSRGNPRTLCPSNPESWDWQRRVIDYVLSFDLDGVTMQSADQGRCPCEECAQWSNNEYHARLNDQVARYIKQNYPDRVVGINNWGMTFEDPADLPHLVAMGQHADYLIDAHDSSRRRDPDYRRQLIAALPCAFGTIGGPNVEPPQHWERDRWFLPTLKRTVANLQALHADGARAVENYMHLFNNPSDDVSIRLALAVEQEPTGDWQPMLRAILDQLYAPTTSAARDGLAELFLGAEEAYFEHTHDLRPSAVVSLEPLVSDRPGPPIYLTKHMTSDGLAGYRRRLEHLREQARSLEGAVGDRERLQLVGRCITCALEDVAFAAAESHKQG